MPIAEIGLGLTLAGVLLDIKDAITAINAFIDAPSASNFGGVIFAGVAFVPGVGDAAKAGWKGARSVTPKLAARSEGSTALSGFERYLNEPEVPRGSSSDYSSPSKSVPEEKAAEHGALDKAIKNHERAGGNIKKLPPKEELHGHHLLPQEFRDFFASRGIEIDDYIISLHKEVHLKEVHGGAKGGGLWNKGWADWIENENNQSASKQDVLDKLNLLRISFGI